jgi:hypothetical protein
MPSIKKLWNEWEIQFLVLLSFTLQSFLFFTGSLRRRNTNMLLNFIIWVAYLGADLVAVYALGFLSRHEDTTTGCDTLRGVHQLAFFWAPFLLIHLGGQDTITAFAIEDNKLWLRHLLNLIVQVTLAIYVFWKSIDRYNHQLIAPGILVSITGIIKYGERTMALMYGNLRDISGSSNINEGGGSRNVEEVPKLEQDVAGYLGIVSFALQSAPGVRELFAGHTLHQMEEYQRDVLIANIHKAHMPKLLEVELDLMYGDLYTKGVGDSYKKWHSVPRSISNFYGSRFCALPCKRPSWTLQQGRCCNHICVVFGRLLPRSLRGINVTDVAMDLVVVEGSKVLGALSTSMHTPSL